MLAETEQLPFHEFCDYQPLPANRDLCFRPGAGAPGDRHCVVADRLVDLDSDLNSNQRRQAWTHPQSKRPSSKP